MTQPPRPSWGDEPDQTRPLAADPATTPLPTGGQPSPAAAQPPGYQQAPPTPTGGVPRPGQAGNFYPFSDQSAAHVGPYTYAEKPYSGAAVAGFIMSWFVPPIGVISSIVGLVNTSPSKQLRGRGLAAAGLIIGILLSLPLILFGAFLANFVGGLLSPGGTNIVLDEQFPVEISGEGTIDESLVEQAEEWLGGPDVDPAALTPQQQAFVDELAAAGYPSAGDAAGDVIAAGQAVCVAQSLGIDPADALTGAGGTDQASAEALVQAAQTHLCGDE